MHFLVFEILGEGVTQFITIFTLQVRRLSMLGLHMIVETVLARK